MKGVDRERVAFKQPAGSPAFLSDPRAGTARGLPSSVAGVLAREESARGDNEHSQSPDQNGLGQAPTSLAPGSTWEGDPLVWRPPAENPRWKNARPPADAAHASHPGAPARAAPSAQPRLTAAAQGPGTRTAVGPGTRQGILAAARAGNPPAAHAKASPSSATAALAGAVPRGSSAVGHAPSHSAAAPGINGSQSQVCSYAHCCTWPWWLPLPAWSPRPHQGRTRAVFLRQNGRWLKLQ